MRGKQILALSGLLLVAVGGVARADSFDLSASGLTVSNLLNDPGTFTVSSTSASMILQDNGGNGPSVIGNFSMTVSLDNGDAKVDDATFTYDGQTTTFGMTDSEPYTMFDSSFDTVTNPSQAEYLFFTPNVLGNSTVGNWVEIDSGDNTIDDDVYNPQNLSNNNVTVDLDFSSPAATPLPRASAGAAALLITVSVFGRGRRAGISAAMAT